MSDKDEIFFLIYKFIMRVLKLRVMVRVSDRQLWAVDGRPSTAGDVQFKPWAVDLEKWYAAEIV